MDQTTVPASSNRKIVALLVLMVIVLGASTGYFYKKTLSQQGTTEEAALAEAESLANKVGKLMVLPSDEVPTIATVADPEALKEQAFFTGTKNGDKVLIYTNAKKAILYDPIQNKILNVAPLNIGDAQSPASAPTETP